MLFVQNFVKKVREEFAKIHQKQVQHQLQAGKDITLTKQLQLRLLRNIKKRNAGKQHSRK